MSNEKHMSLLMNIFLTGLKAFAIVSILFIGVTAAIEYLRMTGSTLTPIDYLRQTLGLPAITVTIIYALLGIAMILGAITPIASRWCPHANYVSILSMSCGTIAVTWPYVVIPLIGGPEGIRMLGLVLAALFPITLIYITSTIFALGEIFYIETNRQLLSQWKWSLREPTTYILLPYYLALLGSTIWFVLIHP